MHRKEAYLAFLHALPMSACPSPCLHPYPVFAPIMDAQPLSVNEGGASRLRAVPNRTFLSFPLLFKSE